MPCIDIRLQSLAQIYESLDPSPFHEKALDRDAEAYLVDCAGEHPPQADLILRVHGPPELRDRLAEVASAIHAHFNLMHEQAERRQHMRSRIGRAALLVGGAVLLAAMVLRRMLDDAPMGGQFLSEGLLVLGWVALWRPMEILLFDRIESRAERLVLRRLATIAVEFQAAAD